MRILMWNIQNFSNARISTTPDPDDPAGTAASQASASFTRDYILTTVAEADPDVFVILEARSSLGDVGTLAEGPGPDGLRKVLALLRGPFTGASPWYLVPPLRANPYTIEAGARNRTRTETVGVFWRNDRVEFTGPLRWPQGSRAGPPGATVVAGPYPPDWAAVVPPGMTRAAQCQFYRPSSRRELEFHEIHHRRPYLTRFKERYGAMRQVRLFSVHSPSGLKDAIVAMSRMDTIQARDWVPGQNEVTVFAGDWNVNDAIPRPLRSGEAAPAFQTLDQMGLARVPSWDSPNVPFSMYDSRDSATPQIYWSNTRREPIKLLDYAFVRYGPPAAPGGIPTAPRMVMADRVAGVVPPPPLALPLFTSDMANTLADIAALAAWTIQPNGVFRDDDGMTEFITDRPHLLQPGDSVQVQHVTPDELGFNGGPFEVKSVFRQRAFTIEQHRKQPGYGGNGFVTSADYDNRVFRGLDNFGHLAAPAHGIGTSDHLPMFFVV